MLQPASGLWQRGGQVRLDETDVKQFVERYLRQLLASDAVYCEAAARGRVKVRAGSALLAQEVRLRQYDLSEALKREANVTLRELQITQS